MDSTRASTPEKLARERALSDAIYELPREDRQGLSASQIRNLLTALLPAIEVEVARAVLAERERCAKVARLAARERGSCNIEASEHIAASILATP